jgi:hypothetical protein
MRADRWDPLGGFALRPVEGPRCGLWQDDPWDRTDFGICIATISELVRSPQLLNCRKHVSELSRAIAVTAKIEATMALIESSSPTVSKRGSRPGRRLSNRPRLAMRMVKSSAPAVPSIILPTPFDILHYVETAHRLPLSSGVARHCAHLIGGLPLEDRVGSGRPDQSAYTQNHIGLSMLSGQTKFRVGMPSIKTIANYFQ